jgi:hypothetical protein
MHAISSKKTIEERTHCVLSQIFAGCSLEKVGVRLWDGTGNRARCAEQDFVHRWGR